VKEIVDDKLPDIIEEAQRLQYRVEEVKEHAGHEFERLNPMDKVKATANFAYNTKQLVKVPPFIKENYEKLKAIYEEVKEVIQELKEHQHDLKKNGADCYGKAMNDPIKCYEHIYGHIKYT